MRALTARALNRATLDRQLLLRLHDMPARQAVRQLTGLQAQARHAPYVGLWCRLADFPPETLSTLITQRSVVRAPIFRGTVHALDAEDFLAFRPLFGPLMAGALRANFTKRLAGADPCEIARRASDLLAERGPLTRTQLGQCGKVRHHGGKRSPPGIHVTGRELSRPLRVTLGVLRFGLCRAVRADYG